MATTTQAIADGQPTKSTVEIVANQFAAESQHWYTKSGESAHWCIGANGKQRPTTLRDARKLGLLPSVTTICRLAAAPALERWKRQQILLAALTLPRHPDEPEQAWLERVEKDSQEEGRKAAERGTAIHAAIERHYLGLPVDPTLMQWVIAAVAEVERVCGRQEWRAEKSFASPLGYGGKVDLHSDYWVIDFKGKENLDGLRLWDDHHCQLGAYSKGLFSHLTMHASIRHAIVFIDRNKPAAQLIEADPAEISKGTQMFLALLAYWKAKTGYQP